MFYFLLKQKKIFFQCINQGNLIGFQWLFKFEIFALNFVWCFLVCEAVVHRTRTATDIFACGIYFNDYRILCFRFVGHVRGSLKNLPLTLSVLRFGEKIRSLKPARLVKHIEPNCLLNMRALEVCISAKLVLEVQRNSVVSKM